MQKIIDSLTQYGGSLGTIGLLVLIVILNVFQNYVGTSNQNAVLTHVNTQMNQEVSKLSEDYNQTIELWSEAQAEIDDFHNQIRTVGIENMEFKFEPIGSNLTGNIQPDVIKKPLVLPEVKYVVQKVPVDNPVASDSVIDDAWKVYCIATTGKEICQ